jgi:hypothetical protein
MRALSLAQASRCETAKNPVCHCRCHGALHGKKRAGEATDAVDREFFEALPADDPHHVRSGEEKKRRARIRRAAAKAKGQGLLWPLLLDEAS